MVRLSKIRFLELSLLVALAIATGCAEPPNTPTTSAPPTTPPPIQTPTSTPAPSPQPTPSPTLPSTLTPTPIAPSPTPAPVPTPKPTPTSPQIKIDSGLVSGALVGDGQVRIYLGIPYAAPPVGDLRWKPPQPVAPWTGVRQCTRCGPASMQLYPRLPVGVSEDCLNLNVYTPARMASDRFPVMVWFHGGGNNLGAGSQYDGTLLTQQGVVVVTVNYRLGPLGWLAHPLLDKESPNKVSGNYGLLDDVAALKWVQTNIAAFGGDAGNVTIFGESAGACAVIDLIASPLARGLFHRAIAQSGGPYWNHSSAEAEKVGETFVARLGVSGAPDVLKALRAKSAEEIVAEAGEPNPLGAGTKHFMPKAVVDGWFLPDSPDNVFRDGKQQNVPLIIGFNSGDPTGLFSSAPMLAGYMSKVQPNVYAYEFTRVPPGWSKAGIPAIHGLELKYLFGHIDQLDKAGEENPVGVSAEVDPVVDGRVSREMIALWVQFAATGNPNVKGMVTWPTYDPTSEKYLDIGDTLQVKSGFSKVTPTPYTGK